VVSPVPLVFKGRWQKFERAPCSLLGSLNPQVTENGNLATSTGYANCIFQQLSLMLKTKKLLWNKNHSDCTHKASFTVEKGFGF